MSVAEIELPQFKPQMQPEWSTDKEQAFHRHHILGKQTTREAGEAAGKLLRMPVRQLTMDGVLVNEFNSMTEAAINLNGMHSTISRACNGIRKSAYGYKWELA